METTRQKRLASLIRKELAEVLRRETSCEQNGMLISVTRVYVTADLGLARVYVSFFPSQEKRHLFEAVRTRSSHYKRQLAERLRHQLRRLPDLDFRSDDSLDYVDLIEKELRGEGENPMK